MIMQFLNRSGLRTFLNEILKFFATTAEVNKIVEDTDIYVLKVDYENDLSFDTSEIISEEENA